MSILKSTIEMDIIEEIVEDNEVLNTVGNKKPNGFDTPINLSEDGIKKVSGIEGIFEASNLELIYLDFADDLSFLPPMVLAKSEKIEPAPSGPNNIRYKFKFLSYFAVRLGENVDITKTFNISMKESWTGTDFTPEFLLDYDSGAPTIKDKFSTFKVSFEIRFSVAPKSITTFVWDQDPEGSRGTETTVQSGTGG